MKVKEVFSKIYKFFKEFSSNDEGIIENSDLLSLKEIEALEQAYKENIKYKKPKKENVPGSNHKPEEFKDQETTTSQNEDTK